MRTLELARQLGFIETIPVNSKSISEFYDQLFDFLFILDFESTCWEGTDILKAPPEIIEFSVVLYHIRHNKIIEEFQQYVMPTEAPRLSEFCRNFTGITQQQVDNGVPLVTCLMVFSKWMKEQTIKFDLAFPSSSKFLHAKKTAFVTWSDWDLNICLHNECKRKKIAKPQIFTAWIDLRALYKEHYNRRPKGLSGALTEVGLKFNGSQHCGLDDARNTAVLTSRMIRDGVMLRITKDISSS